MGGNALQDLQMMRRIPVDETMAGCRLVGCCRCRWLHLGARVEIDVATCSMLVRGPGRACRDLLPPSGARESCLPWMRTSSAEEAVLGDRSDREIACY